MRILFICNHKQGVGGISGQVDILRDRLESEGCPTEVFSTKGNLSYRIRMLPRLLRKGGRFDIFHIHACSWRGFLPVVVGLTAGRILKKRTVLTYHGGDAEAFFNRHPVLIKTFLKRTDCNIVLSGFLEKVFHDYGLPCVVIPNVLDFNEGKYRKRETVSPAFISVRSHTRTYNVSCILAAFKKVGSLYPSASLTVLGDGELHDELVAYASRERLPNVTFVGRVDNAHIYEYLDKADIMLSSPVVDNMPVSLLEAFNAGLLVISSRVGGVPYMMREGVDGLMFSSYDSDELASKMIEAFTEQERTKSMMESAHASLYKYRWADVRPQLFAVYEKVFSGRVPQA